jgi:photosystem II stability/assembly factor-like uncharacterized protein
MNTNHYSIKRLFTLGCLSGFVAALAGGSASAQDTPPAQAVNSTRTRLAGVVPRAGVENSEQPAATREQRIEAIEKQIRELLTAIEELRKSPAASTAPTNSRAIALDSKWLQTLTWRSIGPAGMGGRIVDLAIVESDPSAYWVATASGGLLKTTNSGVTFTHQFDREATVSIGSVSVAPSNPDIVWVGTGENNPRNSVSYGDGVYKSTDGGKTWKNMGLRKTFQIGRMAIHRTNPNIVYVGALGRLYGPNEERGLYKTADGGQTWERVLYIDDKTGVIDVQMHPTDSDTLLVALWERVRDIYDSHPGDPLPDGYDSYDPIQKWGRGAGIYKTTDGGRNWRKLTNGLPTSNLGRVGLDYYRKDPNTIFAIVDCEKIGMGTPPRPAGTAYAGVFPEETESGVRLARVVVDGPGAQAGLQADDIVQTVDDKVIASAEQLNGEIREHKAGDKLKFKVLRDEQVQEIEVTLADRPAGAGGGGRRGGPAGGGRGGAPAGGVYLGITGEDAEGGVRLTTVVDNGPAARAGLKAGDLVKTVGEKAVEKYEELLEEIRAHKVGDKLNFRLQRGEESQRIEVTLAERPPTTAGGPGGPSQTRPSGAVYGGQLENVQDQQGTNSFEYGGIYKSTDGGDSWKRINSLNPRPMYFSQIKVDPSDDQYLYVLGVSLYRSTNGGKIFRPDGGRGVHADQHALWIDPRDGRHMIVGCDGGFYATYDRMANWDHLNNMAIAQFYHVAISPKQPYYVAGGLQDNGSWMGPAVSLSGTGPINEDWMNVGGGDGFVCRVDPNDPDLVYSESQGGVISRRNIRTGERASLRPGRGGGGGAGGGGRRGGGEGETGTGAAGAGRGGGRGGGAGGTNAAYRFNWNTPFILSSHNSRIFYSAGNYVFRSLDRGNNLQIISPEITVSKWGSATALAESPTNSNVLYVGTDDGALWVTRDGGKMWTNITKNVGLPGPRYVATIEPSRYVEGRAYVIFDGHRSDDDEPLVYVTDNFGATWKSLRANLPWGSTRCLREDIQNPNLLFLGTEFGAWCSLDRGQYWNKLGTNLPTVAVHEFAIHPANGEVVAATHGRSLWVLDASALRQIKTEHLADKPALYQPPAVVRWRGEPVRGGTNRRFVGQNPNRGAQIYYSLPKRAEKVAVKIVDIAGATLRELPARREAGLYRLTWDLRGAPPRPTNNIAATPRSGEEAGAAPAAGRGGGGGQRGGGGGGGQRGGGGGGTGGVGGALPAVVSGTYRVVLTVDGEEFAQTLRIEPDPVISDAVAADDQPVVDDEEEEEEREREMEQERERDLLEFDREPEIGG